MGSEYAKGGLAGPEDFGADPYEDPYEGVAIVSLGVFRGWQSPQVLTEVGTSDSAVVREVAEYARDLKLWYIRNASVHRENLGRRLAYRSTILSSSGRTGSLTRDVSTAGWRLNSVSVEEVGEAVFNSLEGCGAIIRKWHTKRGTGEREQYLALVPAELDVWEASRLVQLVTR